VREYHGVCSLSPPTARAGIIAAMLTDTDGNDKYRKGGFYRISDRSGERVRASDTVKEWNGAIVSKDEYEARHPQDFVRGKADKQSVPDPRPAESVANASFVGCSTTASVAAFAAAGATTITVDSTAGFKAGDTVAIMLDSMDRSLNVLSSVPDSATLKLTKPLPGSVSVGNDVIDYTALVPAKIE